MKNGRRLTKGEQVLSGCNGFGGKSGGEGRVEGEEGGGGTAVKFEFGDKGSRGAKAKVVAVGKSYCGGLRG